MLTCAGEEVGHRIAHAHPILLPGGADQREDQPEIDGKKQQGQIDDRPEARAARQKEPASDKENEGGGFDQAAAKIIENLPAGDERNRIADQVARFVGNLIEDPANDLPISAQPAMFAAVVGAVVRRVIVDDFDIGGKTYARIRALNEIVA